MKILFAPRNISGQFSEYQRGFRLLGIESEIWSYDAPKFGFEVDRIISYKSAKLDKRVSFDLFAEAVEKFDTFHFTFGRSLLFPGDQELELIDLPLLKKLKKNVVMHFRGSDVRLRSNHIEEFPNSYMRRMRPSLSDDALLARIDFCREYSSRLLVSTPGLLSYVPNSVLMRHVVDTNFWTFAPSHSPKLRVVHVPSARATKSSEEIVRVCEPLAQRGQIEFSLVENIPRTEMPNLLHSADVLIDSMGIGDHGLISVEAMACGVVPIANLSNLSQQMASGSSIQHASQSTLRETLLSLSSSRSQLENLKMQGRTWVEQHHTFEANLTTLLDAYAERDDDASSPLTLPPYRLVNEINAIRLENRVLRSSLRVFQNGSKVVSIIKGIRRPRSLWNAITRRHSR